VSEEVPEQSIVREESQLGPEFTLRAPGRRDAQAVRQCVLDTDVLEPNSTYAYLLCCEHFASTCVVAEWGGTIVGAVIAYRRPDAWDHLFVWQIGVARLARRRGLARRMLEELFKRPSSYDIRFLEATIDASNLASRQLFASIAAQHGVSMQTQTGFVTANFDGSNHPAEPLIRIGPFVPSISEGGESTGQALSNHEEGQS
jgi:L-2,4-diaminobutyric acid acetyltransferase